MADQYFYCRKCTTTILGESDYKINGVEYEAHEVKNNPSLLKPDNVLFPIPEISHTPSLRFLRDSKTGELVTCRLLVCGHFVSGNQTPAIFIREETSKSLTLTDGSVISEEEILELRKEVLQTITNLSSEALIAIDYFYHLIQAEGMNENELKEIRSNNMPQILAMTPEQLIAHIQEHFNNYRNHLKASKKEKYVIQLIQDELERKGDSLTPQAKMDYDYLFRKTPRNAEKLVREKIKADNSASKKTKSENDALVQMQKAMLASGVNISLEELKTRIHGK